MVMVIEVNYIGIYLEFIIPGHIIVILDSTGHLRRWFAEARPNYLRFMYLIMILELIWEYKFL